MIVDPFQITYDLSDNGLVPHIISTNTDFNQARHNLE
jgi:hypothetical protein